MIALTPVDGDNVGLNVGITNELTKKDTWFDYDTMGNLVGASYNNLTEQLFRVPDAVGTLCATCATTKSSARWQEAAF